MIISFSGVDGSGKSTCAQWTREFLEALGFKVIVSHFFRFSLYFQVGRILRFFSARRADRLVENQYSKEKRKTSANKLLLMVRVVCFVFDSIVFRVIFLNFYKKDEIYYVLDRFFMDQVVQLSYLDAISNRLFIFLLGHSALSDIPFLLKIDPREAMRRKPEFPSEYFERKSYLYSFLAADDKVITIENQDREKTQRKIRETIIGFLENGKN